MTAPAGTEPDQVSDETIYQHLKEYQEAGMIEYVLPSEPLGVPWIVGYKGQILKFGGDGVVAFLMGIQAGALYVNKLKASVTAPLWEHPAWGAEARQAEAQQASDVTRAAKYFAETWAELLPGLPDSYGREMNCAEANAAADLYRALGDDATAALVIAAHADHDTEGDEHYHGRRQATSG